MLCYENMFQMNDHLNQENVKHSLETYIYIKNARNGDSVWFQVDFHYILFTYFGQSVSKLCA